MGFMKKSGEKKSGAGQYFTPRPLIESIVDSKPQLENGIQRSNHSTCGYRHADRYIKSENKDLTTLSEQEAEFSDQDAFYGVELVPDIIFCTLMTILLTWSQT